MQSCIKTDGTRKGTGHAKEWITIDVYGDNACIMPEGIPELLSYMKDGMPEGEEECDMKSDVLDMVIDVGLNLPQQRSEQGQEQTYAIRNKKNKCSECTVQIPSGML